MCYLCTLYYLALMCYLAIFIFSFIFLFAFKIKNTFARYIHTSFHPITCSLFIHSENRRSDDYLNYRTSNDSTSYGDSVSGSININPSFLGAASSAAVAMAAVAMAVMGMVAMVRESVLKVLGPRTGLAV